MDCLYKYLTKTAIFPDKTRGESLPDAAIERAHTSQLPASSDGPLCGSSVFNGILTCEGLRQYECQASNPAATMAWRICSSPTSSASKTTSTSSPMCSATHRRTPGM